MSVSPILHEYALDARGKPQHIKNSDSVPPYKCGDCNGDMVAKRGRIRQWHYSHKANVLCTPKADPDNALHRYAQDIILEAFNRSKEDGTEYLLGMKCLGFHTDTCDERLGCNIALPDSKMLKEVSIAPNTRSDLVLVNSNDSTVILEIVNTHPLDSDTTERYIKSNIPVYVRNLTWDTLRELFVEFIADECLNVESERLCIQCSRRKEAYDAVRKEEIAREAEILEKSRRREAQLRKVRSRREHIIDLALRRLARTRRTKPRFQPWYSVKKEDWYISEIKMYPKTQRAVFANAILLTELGFEQHNQHKPWLFRFKIHKSGKYIYADLGGSDVVPIYEDTAAMLYAPDLEDDDQIEQYAVEQFADSLQSHGVNVRVGFLAGYGVDRQYVDPMRHIERAMLNELVKWDSEPKVVQETNDPAESNDPNMEQLNRIWRERKLESEAKRRQSEHEEAEAWRKINEALNRISRL